MSHPLVLQQALSRLSLRFPFYSAMLLMTDIIEADWVPTAATDGERIFYNREFLEEFGPREVMFILSHEIEHIIRLHAFRREGRDPMGWNIAADHVINTDLMRVGLTAPTDEHGRFVGLADKRFENMPEEKVYRLLEEEAPPPQPDDGDCDMSQEEGGGDGDDDDYDNTEGSSGGGSGGDSEDGQGKGGKGGSSGAPNQPRNIFDGDLQHGTATDKDGKTQKRTKAQAEAAARRVQGKVLQAAAKVEATTGIGDIPAHLRDMIVGLTEPIVDWRAQLRDHITATAATDYSWARLNRRVRHRGLRMPMLHSEEMGGLGIILDTSGSCWHVIPQFLSEVVAIADDVKPERIYLMFVDTQVQVTVDTTWDNFLADMGDLLTQPPHGGGTDLRAGFEQIEQEAPELDAVICLTDMYSPWPESFLLDNNTLFCDLDGGAGTPFGRRIVVEL